MGQMINMGKEIIRINPKQANKIEYSSNDGRSWHNRYSGNSYGDFKDLNSAGNGKEILAITSKGTYYSKNNGVSWHKRGI